jgi:hypothetical protein
LHLNSKGRITVFGRLVLPARHRVSMTSAMRDRTGGVVEMQSRKNEV